MKHEVKCLRLDDKGRGIVKINDKITFIPNLLPNEEAIVKIITNKKRYAEGKLLKLIKESDDRVKPKCTYQNCGCHLNHLNYQKQLEYKQNKVKEILKKFGNINPKINDIVYDNSINHYRNKITLKVNNKVGYFSNHTNDFIPINRCELVSEKVNNLIEVLNKEDLSNVKEITIKDFNELMVIIKGNMDITNIEQYVDTIYINEKLIKGEKYTQTTLKNLTFKISKDSFFQVNKNMTEKLYEIAINYLEKDKEKTVLDLYCGTGTISLFLSKYFKKVIGIEINKEAVKCANINKELNKINNVEFICGDASKEIKKLKADKIIVDPPRSGLTKEGISDILKINPETLVYISCDPITLARDLKILNEKYNILEVTPVEMFPNTFHIENVVKLKRI